MATMQLFEYTISTVYPLSSDIIDVPVGNLLPPVVESFVVSSLSATLSSFPTETGDLDGGTF